MLRQFTGIGVSETAPFGLADKSAGGKSSQTGNFLGNLENALLGLSAEAGSDSENPAADASQATFGNLIPYFWICGDGIFAGQSAASNRISNTPAENNLYGVADIISQLIDNSTQIDNILKTIQNSNNPEESLRDLITKTLGNIEVLQSTVNSASDKNGETKLLETINNLISIAKNAKPGEIQISFSKNQDLGADAGNFNEFVRLLGDFAVYKNNTGAVAGDLSVQSVLKIQQNSGINANAENISPTNIDLTQALDNINPQESKAIQIENKISPQESKAIQIENKISPQESKAIQIENIINPQESKPIQIENKINPQESKPIQIENKINPHELKAIQIENKISPQETNPIQAIENIPQKVNNSQSPASNSQGNVNNNQLSNSINLQNDNTIRQNENTIIDGDNSRIVKSIINTSSGDTTAEVRRLAATDTPAKPLVSENSGNNNANMLKNSEGKNSHISESQTMSGGNSDNQSPTDGKSAGDLKYEPQKEDKSLAIQSNILNNNNLYYSKSIVEKKSENIFESKISPKEFQQTTSQILKKLPENGNATARLTLRPESLGTIFVEISINNKELKLSIRADSPDAMKSIESQIAGLKDKLAADGLKVVSIDIDARQDSGGSTGKGSEGSQYANAKEQRKAKEEFIRTFGFLRKESGEAENSAANQLNQGRLIEKYT